ncbi:DUF7287 family protein [Halosimplex salinum]|uniref:DUF7287 family protein n=1 Tax=Halosimplex salinum TaxID=1710538 RepID=UPI000F463C60|nr:hypothetical protein [Halosimplex salinum]
MERDSGGRRVGFTERAQSVFDFSIGVTLFLVVVLGVLVFVPTAFGSINDDAGVSNEDKLAAERVADHLVGTSLAASNSSRGLSRVCTIAYFRNTAECGFETRNSLSEDSVRASTQPLNVTIEGDIDGDGVRDLLCWDQSAETLARVANCGDPADTSFTGGSSATANQNYVTATRFDRLEGRDVFVVVRTW